MEITFIINENIFRKTEIHYPSPVFSLLFLNAPAPTIILYCVELCAECVMEREGKRLRIVSFSKTFSEASLSKKKRILNTK